MKQRILVIEDDAAIRQGIVDALQFAGYGTFEARNGPDGLRAAMECDCHLVLLDLVLPGKGGLEILKEVRGTRPTLPGSSISGISLSPLKCESSNSPMKERGTITRSST